MNCKNCKYFVRNLSGNTNYGNCRNNNLEYNYMTGIEKSDNKLLYWDYECHDAGMTVGINFGCIHFEEKDK